MVVPAKAVTSGAAASVLAVLGWVGVEILSIERTVVETRTIVQETQKVNVEERALIRATLTEIRGRVRSLERQAALQEGLSGRAGGPYLPSLAAPQ